MKTRSQTTSSIYTVDIDFDEASALWRANKEPIGNGSFKYVCAVITDEKGKRCGARCVSGTVTYCRRHMKTYGSQKM
jgi:hypothetical protein